MKSTARRFLFQLSLVGAAMVLFASPMAAQEPEPPEDAAATSPNEQPPAITAEIIKERQSELEEADLSEEQKAQAEKHYQNALEQIKTAEQHLVDATRWKQLQQDAPTRIERLETTLAEPRASVSVEVPEDATLATLDQKLATARQELSETEARVKQLQQEPRRRADRRI